MLVVGGNEAEAGTVSVRDRFENEANDVAIEAFRDHLDSEVAEKRVEPDFLD
jgi:threonyl-tRNA synthetase